MTLSAILAVIGGLLPIVLAVAEAILNANKNRRDNQNAMGQVDDHTVRDSMDAVDKLYPPAKD